MNSYIISYNRLSSLQNLCIELEKRDCVPIIIDNSSNYPPMLDWLKTCPYQLFRVPNTGSRSPWIYNIVEGEKYIITDSDLDISGVPLDMLYVLEQGLLENDTAVKCGLSLRLDDLPDNKYANQAKEFEARYWLTKVGDYYSAPVDTTLALYSAERLQKICKGNVRHKAFYNAIRSPPPYSARHLPWYNVPGQLSDEEQYYLSHLEISEGFWVHQYKRTYDLT